MSVIKRQVMILRDVIQGFEKKIKELQSECPHPDFEDIICIPGGPALSCIDCGYIKPTLVLEDHDDISEI